MFLLMLGICYILTGLITHSGVLAGFGVLMFLAGIVGAKPVRSRFRSLTHRLSMFKNIARRRKSSAEDILEWLGFDGFIEIEHMPICNGPLCTDTAHPGHEEQLARVQKCSQFQQATRISGCICEPSGGLLDSKN